MVVDADKSDRIELSEVLPLPYLDFNEIEQIRRWFYETDWDENGALEFDEIAFALGTTANYEVAEFIRHWDHFEDRRLSLAKVLYNHKDLISDNDSYVFNILGSHFHTAPKRVEISDLIVKFKSNNKLYESSLFTNKMNDVDDKFD